MPAHHRQSWTEGVSNEDRHGRSIGGRGQRRGHDRAGHVDVAPRRPHRASQAAPRASKSQRRGRRMRARTNAPSPLRRVIASTRACAMPTAHVESRCSPKIASSSPCFAVVSARSMSFASVRTFGRATHQLFRAAQAMYSIPDAEYPRSASMLSEPVTRLSLGQRMRCELTLAVLRAAATHF